jgi:hypothetical protein
VNAGPLPTSLELPTNTLGLPLDPVWAGWLLRALVARGVPTTCAIHDGDGWIVADGDGAREALTVAPIAASIARWPSCCGIRTALLVRAASGATLAVTAARPLGGGEPAAWRSLLLEALLTVGDGRAAAAP